jgi:hypothetical protein
MTLILSLLKSQNIFLYEVGIRISYEKIAMKNQSTKRDKNFNCITLIQGI